MIATNRIYTDVETKHPFRLWMDNADNYYLIADKPKSEQSPAEGTQINGFYICAHTGITIKINSKKTVKLNTGEFYNMKEGEAITHKKFIGFQKFTKL